jgi:hypothetical protein
VSKDKTILKMKKQVAGADVVHADGGEIAADDAALFAVDVDAGVIGPAGVEAAGHDGDGLTRRVFMPRDVAEVLQGAGEQSGTNEEHEAESHLQNDDGFPEADFAGVDVCGSS